ncbi:MAG: MFS transporter, partial [Pseudomonadota bacterium]
YVMFLVGMGVSAVLVGWLLRDFTPLLLVRVIQGAALVGLALNLVALWKQEHVAPMSKSERTAPRPRFRDAWLDFLAGGQAGRLLVVVFFGTMAFNMQDVLLEPYGGEVLGLSVSSTTLLTALWAAGALGGFAFAAKRLSQKASPYRLAATGCMVGLAAFSAVICSAPMNSASLFFVGAVLIGFGGGLFAVATLMAAMSLPAEGVAGRGLALGAWGAAQATAAGLSIAIGGTVRDVVNAHALSGVWGEALALPSTGYSVVYHTEIALIFITLIALGPLVARARRTEQDETTQDMDRIGLADFPT